MRLELTGNVASPQLRLGMRGKRNQRGVVAYRIDSLKSGPLGWETIECARLAERLHKTLTQANSTFEGPFAYLSIITV
jgi:hypothetical protein